MIQAQKNFLHSPNTKKTYHGGLWNQMVYVGYFTSTLGAAQETSALQDDYCGVRRSQNEGVVSNTFTEWNS